MTTTPLRRVLTCLAVGLSAAATATGQAPTVHYQFGLDLPPGAIGQRLRQYRPELVGHMQPVEMRVPKGAAVSVAMDGAFSNAHSDRLTASIEVARIYRFKISQIPKHPAESLYPTVELVDRLHPPEGLQQRFPIRIVIPQEDLELALKGRLVTRVIYLENPNDPYPFPERNDDQRYFDTLPGENPIQVADQMGRPMAIVRIGSRTPDGVPNEEFMFGSPPVSLFESTEPLDQQPLAPIIKKPAKTQLPVTPLLDGPEAGSESNATPETTTPEALPTDDESMEASPLDETDAFPDDPLPEEGGLLDEPLSDDPGIELDDSLPESDDFDLEGLDEL